MSGPADGSRGARREFARGHDEHRWQQLEDDLSMTPRARLQWLEETKAHSLRWLGAATRVSNPGVPPDAFADGTG